MKLGIRDLLTNVITCVKFLIDRFRGYGVLTPPKLPFPIDLLLRRYNSVALPCDTAMDDWFVQVKGCGGDGGRSRLYTCCCVVCVDVLQWVMMTGRELLGLHVNTKVIYICSKY